MRLLPLLLVLCACQSQYDIRVRFVEGADRARSTRVQVAVVPSCGEQRDGAAPTRPVRLVEFAVDEPSGALGELPPDDYGLYARAIDGECQVVAAGCTPIVLNEGGAGTLSVELRSVSATGSVCEASAQCVEGECIGGVDASDVGDPSDGSVDASMDVSIADSGPADVSTDVPTDVPMDSQMDAADAGPEEDCSPGLNSIPLDEDSDGQVDEGCPWHFGQPHVLTRVQTSASVLGGSLSGDGRRMYVPIGDAIGPIQRFTRATLGEPFTRATPQAMDGTEGYVHSRVTTSLDEEWLVTESRNGDLTSTRLYQQASDGVYTHVRNIPRLAAPWFSAGGLYGLLDGRFGRFGVAAGEVTSVFTTLSAPGVGSEITLTPDGLTLFSVVGGDVFVAHRPSTDVGFDTAAIIEELQNAHSPMYWPESREMWFSFSQPDPQLVRAEVCRDAACPAYEQPACDSRINRSPDGTRCFYRPATLGPFAAAVCGGDQVASIVTPQEAAAASGLTGYIGLMRAGSELSWITGEPYIHTNWAAGHPGGAIGTCVRATPVSLGTEWRLGSCDTTAPMVCERVILPRWIP